MRQRIFIFILFLFPVLLQAQQGSTDSAGVKKIIAQASAAGSDDAAELLEKAIILSRQISYDRGSDLAFRNLITLYKSKGWVGPELRTRIQYGNFLSSKKRFRDLATLTYETGNLYFVSHLYSKAEDAYREADVLAVQYAPELHYEILRQSGVTARYLKKWDVAQAKLNAATGIARSSRKINDLFWIYQQQAEIAHEQGQYLQAFEINKKIYNLADSLGKPDQKRIALNNLGYAARYAEQLAEAENFFNAALQLNPSGKDDVMRAQLLQSLGILKQNRQDYKSAVALLDEAAQLYRKTGNEDDEARVANFLALVYYQNGDNYRAMSTCTKAIQLARKNKNNFILVDSYEILSLINQSLHDYEDALKAFKTHLALKDSVNQEEQNKQNELLQQQFLLERMEKEMRLLHVAEEIKDLEIAKLTSEKNLESERVIVLQKEALLRTSELRNQDLLARETRAQLELLQKQSQLDKKNSEITLLNREKQIQLLELEKEKLNAQEAERQKNLAEKEKRIGELELTQVKTRSRNLIYFAAGLLLLIVGAIITLVILRKKNKRIEKQNETILENQRIIQIEKEKSDKLLLNILPPVVAAELKETNRYKPRLYNEASILFTDFSKFTTIAEQLSPEEMIETLDRIFLAFDNICETFGLNRIKTIGDSYMCVSGLPEPDAQHAVNTVHAALAMRDFMRDFNRKSMAAGGPEWAIRIGINSGPVIAGVVGIKKFAYDVWGDSVNTASRMESSGEIDHVNISGATWEQVHTHFKCTPRGKISAKNKGEIEMYFVDRKG